MSGIYESIYATMLAEGRSYEDISQSVERLHEYLSGSHIDRSYEYQPRCASCNHEKRPQLTKTSAHAMRYRVLTPRYN